MNTEKSINEEKGNAVLPLTSGYPIHVYKWGTEKETYCGIDLNTKGISFVVSSQVKAFINDDKSKICQKCASYHYR
jgi:hypothetical protein